MFNLNEKYFSISERCGRNHQNKFCLRPLKGRLGPWELSVIFGQKIQQKFQKSDFWDMNLLGYIEILKISELGKQSQHLLRTLMDPVYKMG